MATIAGTGPFSFSTIKYIMGGPTTTAISIGTYYSDKKYAQGVSGIPTYGSGVLSMSFFRSKAKALNNGFLYRYYTSYFNDDVTFFEKNTETATGIATDLSTLTAATPGTTLNNDLISVEWFGYFYATSTGTWTFYTTSDDASYLWIGNTALAGYNTTNALVQNGGLHGAVEKFGTVSLTAGQYYPIRIQYGENYEAQLFQAAFTPPGGTKTTDFSNNVFYGLGTSSSFPGLSARLIRSITNSDVDGVYYINVNGISTATYCLMHNKWNGGGWMLLLKATTSNTFGFSSSYWTDINTTLNTTSTNRNNGDAKFNAMNYQMVKDVMALWPDVPYTGGSISQTETWSWLVNNYYTYSGGNRSTLITGFSTSTSRDSPVNPDPTTFTGFSSSIWSSQSPAKRHIFGGGSHLSANANVRWGFIWNENSANDFTSIDAFGGIGMNNIGYSCGDFYGCCGVSGLNKSMRVEIYGR